MSEEIQLVFDPVVGGDSPLYWQVYQQLRQGILNGVIPAGVRLPSSRQLAAQYQLARVTISQAYEQLRAEGYVLSRPGAGTYVVDQLPVLAPAGPPPPIHLSHWGQRAMTIHQLGEEKFLPGRGLIDFGFGRVLPHLFPYDIWRRLLNRYLSTDDTILSRYGSVAGFEPLRQVLADYLVRMRGVRCTAEQIVIVNGSQQALDILCRLLLNRGDEVLMETPGYVDAFELFRTYGAKLSGIAVDEAGLQVKSIPAGLHPRLVFVTPTNQFPKGGTMPLARRLALLRWAQQVNGLIIEDDYDGALRYEGRPVTALQGLDQSGRVIYLGTFSKVLLPALRLAYVVLPVALVGPFLQAKQIIDRAASTLTQAAVTDFIGEGHFERHLRRLCHAYGQRRQLLVTALKSRLANLPFVDDPAGLHIMLSLPPRFNEKEVVRLAATAGVAVYPGAPYHLQKPAPPSILLGFSGLEPAKIEEGITRFATALHHYPKQHTEQQTNLL